MTQEEKQQLMADLIEKNTALMDAMKQFVKALVPLVEQAAKEFFEFNTAFYFPGMGGRGIKRRDATIDGTKEEVTPI